MSDKLCRQLKRKYQLAKFWVVLVVSAVTKFSVHGRHSNVISSKQVLLDSLIVISTKFQDWISTKRLLMEIPIGIMAGTYLVEIVQNCFWKHFINNFIMIALPVKFTIDT